MSEFYNSSVRVDFTTNRHNIPDPFENQPVDVVYHKTQAGLWVLEAMPQTVGSTDQLDQLKVIIMLPQWSDHVGKTWCNLRAAVLAAKTGKRVLMVETPGVNPAGPRMSKDVREDLLRGDFSSAAYQQWAAIEEALDKGNNPLSAIDTMYGSSQGSHMMAALVRYSPPGDVHVDSLNFGEITALTPQQTLAQYALNYILHGAAGLGSVLRDNPNWAGKPPGSGLPNLAHCFIWRPGGLIAYPVAMHKTPVAGLIEQAVDSRRKPVVDKDSLVTVRSGKESKISKIGDNQDFCRKLGGLGLQVVHILDAKGTHASPDNMGWFAQYVQCVMELEGLFPHS